ncbi:MAG: transglycosylase SLT domain-containing protein [Candidimonas sp.]
MPGLYAGFVLCVAAAMPWAARGATADVAAPSSPARTALIEARDMVNKKQWTALARLVPLAQTDATLGSYARYWILRRQLQDSTQPVPETELREFMATNQDAYLADRIKGDWLIAAARSGDYARALQLAPIQNSNAQIRCSLILSQHMMRQPVTAGQALDAFQPSTACWSMLDQLAVSRIVSREDVLGLLRATLETNRSGDAQRLAAIVFDGKAMVQYAALMKNPRQWLNGRAALSTPDDVELTTIALSRLARGDARLSNADYIQQQWSGRLPAKQLEWVWSQFGLVAALNVEQDAAKWYRMSGEQPLTDYNHAWQVRSELRQPKIDWKRVEAAVDRMSEQQAAEPVWIYWKARALAAQGRDQAARDLYGVITEDLNFYGQLAREELGLAPYVPPAPAPVTSAELQAARGNPGLRRAIELFRLGWRAEAVPEWAFALRGMDDRRLLAAAELARQEHIYDRVVNTSLLTREQVDFSQRFIAPFEGRVAEKARQINLDPAWVYGLIRQESRFITDARSRVGASGLMQLMPATARWVANKIGMKDFKPSQVNDFDVNTVLGTNYLRIVLNDLNGSEVLATAGYNAGPRRPVQWSAKLAGPVEGAIFAETIPFTETRLYVKNVLSNATYYAMMFSGKPHSLKERLGTVYPSQARGSKTP